MADVRNYQQEKEKRARSRSAYKDKIRKHRLSALYRAGLVLFVILVLGIIAYFQYQNHIYTTYDVITTVEKEKVPSSVNVRLGNNILTYSTDGAHCTNQKGEVLWNQTFEMQDMMVSISGDMVAIADYNGREVYVLSSTAKVREVQTTMPIRNICVAADGSVAVSVADSKITWIYIYRTNGEDCVVKTTMNQSGYPISFSLSPNGELLGLSCIFVDSGVMKSQVAFYNFGSVGSNKSDYLVNAYNCQDTIVPYIKFMNDNTAFAVGDDALMIFNGSQIPTMVAQYLYEDEVKAVYNSENYLGLLYRSDQMDKQHKLNVYNAGADLVGSYYFDIDFTDLFFGEKNFVAYNNESCLIKSFSDVDKFNGSFEKEVNLVLPVGRGAGYKYVLVTNDGMDIVQLR